jgi:hypothetical protein
MGFAGSGPARMAGAKYEERVLDRGSGESPAAEDVEDQSDEGYDQQQVDQATADVEGEAQKPQQGEHYDNRPQHVSCLS